MSAVSRRPVETEDPGDEQRAPAPRDAATRHGGHGGARGGDRGLLRSHGDRCRPRMDPADRRRVPPMDRVAPDRMADGGRRGLQRGRDGLRDGADTRSGSPGGWRSGGGGGTSPRSSPRSSSRRSLIGTLKALYDRPRALGSLVETSSASFPSGHAVAASVTAVAAVIALVPEGPRRYRWGAAAVAFSSLMGLSRDLPGSALALGRGRRHPVGNIDRTRDRSGHAPCARTSIVRRRHVAGIAPSPPRPTQRVHVRKSAAPIPGSRGGPSVVTA